MKVVTWNIDFKTDKSKLWDYIDKEINPDILLLQECRNFPSIYQGIGEQIGGTRSWGSVVLSKKYTLEPIYLPNHVGWVAGARIEVNNFKFLVFSIHAKLKDIGRYVVPHLKNIFNDIMESAGDTQNIIIGGDFNAARLYDSIYFQTVYLDFSSFSRSLYVIDIYTSKQKSLSFPRKVGASLCLLVFSRMPAVGKNERI